MIEAPVMCLAMNAEGRNDGPMSECCDAPLDGFENGLGRCSDCGEMAGAWNADELEEVYQQFEKRAA